MDFLTSLKFKFTLVTLFVSYVIMVFVFSFGNVLTQDEAYLEVVKFRQWYQKTIQETLLAKNAPLFARDHTIFAQTIKEKILGKHHLNVSVQSEQEGYLVIQSFALVDKNSHLFAQWGKQRFEQGDVGAQLPISVRDDLADALLGRYNSGVEYLENDHVMVVLPLEQNGRIVGAAMSEQVWHRPLFSLSSWQKVTYLPLKELLLVSLVPLVLVLLVLIIMFVYSTQMMKGYVKRFQVIANSWANGDLTSKLPTEGPQEISKSFEQLNAIVARLQKSLWVEQKLQRMKHQNRLANQLHDTVKQSLFANNLTLATCQKAIEHQDIVMASQVLLKAIENNQTAFQQVSALISTSEAGLETVTKQEFSQKLVALKRQFDFHYEESISISETLPFEVADLLLRALQEGLQNVDKHSRPKVADGELCVAAIRLEQNDHWIKLFIADNGGQVQQPIIFGQGLSLLQQSTQLLGGEFEFSSYNNQHRAGMMLSIRIPISEER